jgi:iron(III) transport system substrate-binding protein
MGRPRTAIPPVLNEESAARLSPLGTGAGVGWRGVSFVLSAFLLPLLTSPAFAAEVRVLVLTPHGESIRIEFKRGFAAWHERRYGEPGRVEWRDVGGTSDAMKFLQSEFARKTNGIGIDCFFGGGMEPYLLLGERKLVERYRPPPAILDHIPPQLNGVELYDPGGAWHGAALSSFGILQNTRLERLIGLPLVTRWADLAKPELCGWVGVGDPRNSGSMNVMFEAFLQAYGWDRGWRLLAQIGGNARQFDRISSVTAKDVTLGETAYGFAIDFYGFTQVAAAGRSNLTFTLPQDFAATTPDGLCILKGAPNLVAARRFVDFVLSEDGQKLWFLPKGAPDGPQQSSIERMSIRPDFYRRYRGLSNIESSPFDVRQPFVYNSKLGSERREIIAALVGALLVDTHPELQRAWRAVLARGGRESDLDQLGRAPVSEPEALQLAATVWKDPALRNQKKIEWQQWALLKYRALR